MTSTMSTPRAATTARTSDPASVLASARWAEAPAWPAPAGPADGRGVAGAEAAVGAAVGVAVPAEVNRAARLTARAASTVPWPVPGPAALSAAAVPPGVTVLLTRAWLT